MPYFIAFLREFWSAQLIQDRIYIHLGYMTEVYLGGIAVIIGKF